MDSIDTTEKKQPDVAAGKTESGPPRMKSFITPFMIDVIGGIGSILAAAATAKFFVDTHVYKNLSSLGLFDRMKPERKEAFQKIQELRDSGKITAEESYKMIQTLIRKNEAKANVLLKELGASNWMDRVSLLRTHQKAEAAVWSMAAGSVALGSVVEMTRGLFTSEQEEKLAAGGKNGDADKAESTRT